MFASIHFDIIIIESELTFINKYVFVIAGKAQTGKDATAKLIRKYLEKYNLKTAIIQYSMYVKLYARALTGWDFEEETKPRTLLQNIGQDVRNMVSQRFFINRIIDDIRILANYVDIIVISDARLPEEIDDIKKEFPHVYRIHIIKNNASNNLTYTEAHHITEIALDNYNDFDYTILNDGNIESLEKNVDKILQEIMKGKEK